MADLTAADVAAKLKDKGHKVRRHVCKDGVPVRSDDGGYKTTERLVTASDVVSFSERDGVVTAVTCDGQKLTA